jgi:hypothetical protein
VRGARATTPDHESDLLRLIVDTPGSLLVAVTRVPQLMGI